MAIIVIYITQFGIHLFVCVGCVFFFFSFLFSLSSIINFCLFCSTNLCSSLKTSRLNHVICVSFCSVVDGEMPLYRFFTYHIVIAVFIIMFYFPAIRTHFFVLFTHTEWKCERVHFIRQSSSVEFVCTQCAIDFLES